MQFVYIMKITVLAIMMANTKTVDNDGVHDDDDDDDHEDDNNNEYEHI